MPLSLARLMPARCRSATATTCGTVKLTVAVVVMPSVALSDATVARLVSELADYLLFVGEAPPVVPVEPRPGFAAHLASRTPKDRHGRSLGQLDLVKRLLRYPCSYMVYSEAFERLPPAVKDAVDHRMFEILPGKDVQRKYAHLSADDRRAILEILRDTKHVEL
ncbi:MAG: hypothetical protein HYS05_06705 [Acidobacteria bacterium]|nr:hypothetical protein [Acidobacteriota bacterium]